MRDLRSSRYKFTSCQNANQSINWKTERSEGERVVIDENEPKSVKFAFSSSRTDISLQVMSSNALFDGSNKDNDLSMGLGLSDTGERGKFVEMNPLATKVGSISGKTEFDESHISRFLQSLSPRVRSEVENYVSMVTEDRRAVDRQTIRELIDEINNLTLKIESIQGFNEFVNENFDLEHYGRAEYRKDRRIVDESVASRNWQNVHTADVDDDKRVKGDRQRLAQNEAWRI